MIKININLKTIKIMSNRKREDAIKQLKKEELGSLIGTVIFGAFLYVAYSVCNGFYDAKRDRRVYAQGVKDAYDFSEHKYEGPNGEFLNNMKKAK